MRRRALVPFAVVAAVVVAAVVYLGARHAAPVRVPGAGPVSGAGSPTSDVEDLRGRHLVVPIEGADVEKWKGSFDEMRDGHRHDAVDILAPRNTPIRAVDDGTIAKLFLSKAGGVTIYEFDPSGRYIYYYAHLERYGDVKEGETVRRGQVIGYVGTSGDAPANTPHLHFEIQHALDHKWWQGRSIDPYLVYSRGQV